MAKKQCRRAAVFAFALAALSVTGAHAQQSALNIYNWNDYIAPETVPEFEKATGIKVTYDLYDANETLEAKLSAGGSGYDLVVPSLVPFAARQIQAGFYQPLNKAKLPNAVHLDKSLLARMAVYDKDNTYLIPWMTGVIGVAYNVDKIKQIMPDAPVDSLRMIFDPEVVSKFKDCGVYMIDSPTEVFPPALKTLGLNPDSQVIADLQKAADVHFKIRPYIRKYDSSEYINALANGDICVAWGYSSDIQIAKHRAIEAGKGVHIAFSIPKEGAQRYIDTMAIPKDAPHPEAALTFLNYIMQPEVIAKTSNKIYVQSGNADARQFVVPEVANDTGIFPTPEVEQTIYAISPSTPDVDRARTRYWTRVKTGH
ncbi:polyamine ABC transporter substrate-binding protein [Telmatospirillum siberiense]|uniref:Putrescine-binding periplasmic protein n=1 Tax=Telmatospirillum siberiense TaxID=382514 RepID=A0A2N3PUZ0_9PROT|nr:polyamine ABC transporter substrate-binding protein [Telmatospirillum siberiense]PKU24223.1 spermidine/putrescine ABC transporter substrate-binding protein PotF [Telmatospirillum siberiense]